MSGGSLLRKLLVGYDGSAQSERALAFAVEIASHDEGSMIHIACVVQKPAGAPDPVPDELMESLKRSAKETLLNAERMVMKSHVDVTSHIEAGKPGEKLLELAAALKPDLVVLGTLRHPASERRLGTTSSHFLKSGSCPLLLVP